MAAFAPGSGDGCGFCWSAYKCDEQHDDDGAGPNPADEVEVYLPLVDDGGAAQEVVGENRSAAHDCCAGKQGACFPPGLQPNNISASLAAVGLQRRQQEAWHSRASQTGSQEQNAQQYTGAKSFQLLTSQPLLMLLICKLLGVLPWYAWISQHPQADDGQVPAPIIMRTEQVKGHCHMHLAHLAHSMPHGSVHSFNMAKLMLVTRCGCQAEQAHMCSQPHACSRSAEICRCGQIPWVKAALQAQV